jgi:hypothetical protein
MAGKSSLLAICREHYRRRKAASSFIVLLNKNRIGLLTAGARDGNRSRNLRTIGNRNREFMGDFLDMP